MNFRRIKYITLNFFPVALLIRISRILIIPGFDGMSIYAVSSFFFRGLWQGSITTRASALSFTFFLALFPAILFFFTLIPYIPVTGFQDTLLAILQNILPKETSVNTLSAIEDIIKRQHGGLLSLGFIAALFFATNGISGIMNAFNDSVHIKETRSFIRQKLIAIMLVIIIAILIIIAISLIIAGTSLLNYLLSHGFLKGNIIYYVLFVVKWIIIIALFFFANSFLYYFAPSHHGKFRFISAGSTLATILFILTSVAFNFFISHFSQYNKLYGSIGALIIILTWIYFNAIVLLTGFELNASIMNARGKSEKKKS